MATRTGTPGGIGSPGTAPRPVQAARTPPKWLFKYLVNPLMSTLLRSPLGSKLGQMLLLLSFRGRKSGQVYTTPVSYHRRAGELIVFTDSPWWKNLRGAPVRLRLAGRRVRGWAEATDDPAALLEATLHFLPQVGVKNARRLALSIPADHEPTPEELRQALQGHALIRIRLDARERGAVKSQELCRPPA